MRSLCVVLAITSQLLFSALAVPLFSRDIVLPCMTAADCPPPDAQLSVSWQCSKNLCTAVCANGSPDIAACGAVNSNTSMIVSPATVTLPGVPPASQVVIPTAVASNAKSLPATLPGSGPAATLAPNDTSFSSATQSSAAATASATASAIAGKAGAGTKRGSLSALIFPAIVAAVFSI
ncbi:hypothetical protein M427DRAFT_152227 [Gonapodya prolifera JEL478]|uniref:Extracellular membrane protein CFEM domain-containing protein n=1 Tax=Gonapodya prolifera (strain JEL478) TaxID=1344416 RepID=A0A139ASL2_GONPJ|nr:hypothetical protein M427DRAFT_152227 [Gonapodya prolifera JEL478]|eukprot:KXS19732.1 hypothetical protein M427DRAFT_152227 [Gonapodya prolifera JEL478]